MPIGDGRVCDTLKKRLVGNPESESKVALLGPRTIKLQPAPDEAAANNGVKSLEQIKAEKAATQWKWKNKSHHELYEEMRECDQNASEEMKDRQEQLQRAEEEFDRQEVLARTEEEIEHIKKLREEKEREFESFIQEIKACVEMPGTKFNRKNFGISFGLKNGLLFHFDSETCLNLPIFEHFLSEGNLEPKLKWFFKPKLEPKFFY